MNDLLTSRQVQEILKVDRITVYRMLQDGRLTGIKIGQQWRFHLADVERLLGVNPPEVENIPANLSTGFPTHCVQTIQDLFSDLGQISAVVIDMQGNPLTEVSRPTRFYQLLFASQSGQASCRSSWQAFARDSMAVNGQTGSKFFTCFAGLQYIGAPILNKDSQVGLYLAGQFYWQPPDPREQAERIRRLASACNLDQNELMDAAREIPVIDADQHMRVESWPFSAARAVQSILSERTNFIDRLRQIADLTQL